jgi:dTDP-4-dehydrorhamnose reductase
MANPATEYGRQKADAERLLLKINKPVSVVRLSKIITPGMPLFGNWIDSLKNNIPVHPFSDLKFSPIPLKWVIDILATVAEQKIAGILQLSGNDELTYAQAAMHIAKTISADLSLVQPVKASESGVYLEAVPAYTTLDTNRLEKEFGIAPPDIWQTIEKGCVYE